MKSETKAPEKQEKNPMNSVDKQAKRIEPEIETDSSLLKNRKTL